MKKNIAESLQKFTSYLKKTKSEIGFIKFPTKKELYQRTSWVFIVCGIVSGFFVLVDVLIKLGLAALY
jgi:preprotein translocase SecE subunit